MKRLLLIACCFYFSASRAQNYTHDKIQLLSRWDDTTIVNLSHYNNRYSGIWGYAANGREYALLGAANGAHIIDITDPYQPVRVATVPGRRVGCIWREYKVYQHYAYLVSDDQGPNSFQIIDLAYLPDSVHVIYDGTSLFERSHTIFIDSNRLYSGSTTFSTHQSTTMSVYSLANPSMPVLLRTLDDDWPDLVGAVHDMFVKNDTIYASCGYDGMVVLHLDGNYHFQLLGALLHYPFQGYNHSSCLTADGNHLVMMDEVPMGLPIKSVLIHSPNDLEVIQTFSSGSHATPHNPFLCDNDRVAIAYYEDGLQVFDYSNPANPVRTGFFDTHYQTAPDSAIGIYAGAWGAYTQLPSRHIIVSDMQNGLFVLDADSALRINTTAIRSIEDKTGFVKIYPNPAKDQLFIENNGIAIEQINIYNTTGSLVMAASSIINHQLSIENLAAGVYIAEIKTKDGSVRKRWVKM